MLFSNKQWEYKYLELTEKAFHSLRINPISGITCLEFNIGVVFQNSIFRSYCFVLAKNLNTKILTLLHLWFTKFAGFHCGEKHFLLWTDTKMPDVVHIKSFETMKNRCFLPEFRMIEITGLFPLCIYYISIGFTSHWI